MNKLSYQLIIILMFFINFIQCDDRLNDKTARIVCGVRAKDKCSEPLRQHLSYKHLSYGKTEQELINTCKKIQKVTECLEGLAEMCQTSSDRIRSQVERTLNGYQRVQFELCSMNSGFRLKYLKHGHCIDKVGLETAKCIKDYNDEMENLIHEIPHRKQKFGFVHTDSFCCALERHNECAREIIEPRCNRSAADLANELFRITSGDITNHCRDEQNYRECSGPHDYVNNYLLLLSFIVIKLFKF